MSLLDGSGKELRKWADQAMFAAEGIDRVAGEPVMPHVYLLDPPNDPLGHIAAMSMMYEGTVIRSTSHVTDEQRRYYLEQIKKTKLQAPFESVQLHFMIEGVTRSFTHQMVRQRTAVYAQESLRFAVKGNLAEEAALPPSLMGAEADSRQLSAWREVMATIQDGYGQLIDAGMPAEDARGLLPHATTTRLHYVTNLRNLIEHAGNRLCTQAQFEWRLVLSQLVQALREGGAGLAYRRPDLNGAREPARVNSRWQYEALTDGLFKPACYLAGHCPFEAQFDRHCSIRDRVRAFAAHGVPSSQWEKGARVDDKDTFRTIPAIDQAEWLLDPTAARIPG